MEIGDRRSENVRSMPSDYPSRASLTSQRASTRRYRALNTELRSEHTVLRCNKVTTEFRNRDWDLRS